VQIASGAHNSRTHTLKVCSRLDGSRLDEAQIGPWGIVGADPPFFELRGV